MDERIRNILHSIIDALGGGHQHLHDALDDAARPGEPAADDKPADAAPAEPSAGV